MTSSGKRGVNLTTCIANSLRLLTLPDDVVKLIEAQKLTAGHAKILVGLTNASSDVLIRINLY